MSMAIIAGVVGAGATIYGASQSGGGSAPAPAQLNPRQSILSYIRGVSGGMPLLYGTESNWRPQFGDLNIGDQTQYLNALLGLGGNAAGAAGDQIETERDRELANMRGNVGSANAILDAINPQGRQRVNEANQMASDAFTRAQGPLSWQESRGANQQAREAFSARGRVGDNAAVASEILGREEVMAGKRAEATQLGNNAAALAGQFTNPIMGLLQGVPAGVSLGQDYLNQSQRIIGQNTPQLINPDAGINMGMAQASALNSYNMSRAAAQQNSAAQWGQLGSSLMGLAGTLYQNR